MFNTEITTCVLHFSTCLETEILQDRTGRRTSPACQGHGQKAGCKDPEQSGAEGRAPREGARAGAFTGGDNTKLDINLFDGSLETNYNIL